MFLFLSPTRLRVLAYVFDSDSVSVSDFVISDFACHRPLLILRSGVPVAHQPKHGQAGVVGPALAEPSLDVDGSIAESRSVGRRWLLRRLEGADIERACVCILLGFLLVCCTMSLPSGAAHNVGAFTLSPLMDGLQL